jgi:LPXTG-motif cell wall-anchored protein
MRRKGNIKRMVSGLLAVVTVLSSVVSPATTYASGLEQAEPPAYEEVRELLDADEVVTASDHEIETGSDFDAESDFTGIDIPDEEKVRVTFEEAKNADGEDFSTSHADTYKAVYYVEPQTTDHPVYQISRKIVVRESKISGSGTDDAGASPESQDPGQNGGSADDGEDDRQILTEDDLDAALEAAEGQDTVDEESGLTLSDVLEEAADQEISLLDMEAGETITFTADAPSVFSGRSTQSVDVTRGSAYYYSSYGLGTYATYPYTVKFGSVSATAYCVQPSKSSPGDGTYSISKLSDGKTLAKVCYYGTKASGDNGFFAEKHPDFSAGKRFIITHMAASYANGSSDAFSGTNSTGKSLAMELYNYCVSQPDIPDVEMSFSDADVTAYVDGSSQRTKEITFKADELQTITMKLPDGVKFHNVTTGKTSAVGASVEVSGGTKFYLSAPLTQAEDVKGSWSVTMKGSITKDYSAYKISTGSGSQDLALVFGEGVDDEKYVDFKVTWVKTAAIEIIKKDSETGANLAGAVYGIYSDKDCTELIKKMPATDSNGASSVTLTKTQDTVYLKEITAPAGYTVDTKAYGIEIKTGDTVSKTVTDTRISATIKLVKQGETLAGFGTDFSYETGNLAGAVYNVYAAEDIYTADNQTDEDGNRNVAYASGTLVATVTTDADGKAVVENLLLGKYRIEEVTAPEGYVLSGYSQEVELVYAGQDIPVISEEVTFTNDRQKVSITVEKQDAQTGEMLSGVSFGLYNAEDISAGGSVIVPADTLLETVTSDGNGQAVFTLDLPLGQYYVKELAALDGYVSSDEILTFDASYQGQEVSVVTLKSVMKNTATTVEITKSDLTTGEELPGANLQVTDEDGNVVDAWVSGKEAHIIRKLTVGKTYTLTETLPADGYVTAESIDFTIENTAEIQKVEMKDDVTKVEISKTDITGKKELAGATLTILDSDGNVVETWVSTGEAHYIERLPIGTYTLREEQAPDGYLVAEDVTFEVKDTAEIQKVVMKDEAIPSSVPKTGDNTSLWIPVLLMVLSAAGLAGMMGKRRRKRKAD